jgi:hypothetical protein
MTLFILAFVLYLVGFIGALIEGAGEVWLWFLALGIVLDFTLILLAYLDSARLRFVKESATWTKICHLLALIPYCTGCLLATEGGNFMVFPPSGLNSDIMELFHFQSI